MENVRYRDAMAETLYYLRGIRVEDLKKIPPKLLKYIHKNANKSMNIIYTTFRTVV